MSILRHDKDPKTYLVLGAPHSATSLVSKALEEQGIDMGNNMVGLYQNHSFWSTNVRILKEAGGAWNDPPPEDAILATDQDKRIKRHIDRFKSDMWGFKDPRTSLTVKKYLPHLAGDVYLICCFRKPERVVSSFATHRKVTRGVVDRYNEAIVSAIKEFCEL